VAFVDYTTAYPSVHRDGLSFTLLKNDIRGNMWYHLRARFDKIKLRTLHPGISAHSTVDILRGLPEGIRLSPTLFGKYVADLVHKLRVKFPQKRAKFPLCGYAIWTLARVLHVYGDHTGLLADTGIPPLQLTKYVHLAQLHFRLHFFPKNLTRPFPSPTFTSQPSITTHGTRLTPLRYPYKLTPSLTWPYNPSKIVNVP